MIDDDFRIDIDRERFEKYYDIMKNYGIILI